MRCQAATAGRIAPHPVIMDELSVALDHADPAGERITAFAREVAS